MIFFPEYFLIQTISFCNANCLICPYTETLQEQEQGKMDLTLFKKIIDETTHFQTHVKQVMPYLMNEPLMDKQLINRVKYIRPKLPGVWIHLVTNGMLINDAWADNLIASPLNSIKISILAHRKETYETVMGVKGFDEIFRRIVRFAEKALKVRGKDWLTICFTNTPGYVSTDEMMEAKRFWNSRGANYEMIDHPISRAGNVSLIDAPRHRHISGCSSIWRDEMIHILFNGDVVLCCMDWRREVVIGNVREKSVYEVWNSKRNRYYQKLINGENMAPPDFLCYRCEAAIIR